MDAYTRMELSRKTEILSNFSLEDKKSFDFITSLREVFTGYEEIDWTSEMVRDAKTKKIFEPFEYLQIYHCRTKEHVRQLVCLLEVKSFDCYFGAWRHYLDLEYLLMLI